jgi:hypothetical protein
VPGSSQTLAVAIVGGVRGLRVGVIVVTEVGGLVQLALESGSASR